MYFVLSIGKVSTWSVVSMAPIGTQSRRFQLVSSTRTNSTRSLLLNRFTYCTDQTRTRRKVTTEILIVTVTAVLLCVCTAVLLMAQMLEVSKTANVAAITKAYRKLARTKHPDKGGDPEEFKALAEAYEVHTVATAAVVRGLFLTCF